MATQKVKIGGVVYGNVGDVKTEKENVYYHQVRTLDGILHEKIRYSLTHHTVQFFNLIDGVYDSLKAYIKANKDVPVECGFPIDNGDEDDDTDFDVAEYKLTITDEIDKGYLNGEYFRNGLTVRFEAVRPDEGGET